MTHAQQYLLDALLKEIEPMFEEDRPSLLSTFMRRLRNPRQQPAPVAPAAPPAEYRPSPMLSLGLRCPKCGKLIANSHFSVHEVYCKNWAEWSGKK